MQPLFVIVCLYTICIYGPMAAMSIGAGVTFAAFLFFRRGELRKDLDTVRDSPLFWPTLIFAFSCIWSLVWAKISGLTFYGAQPQINWIGDSAKIWHLLFPLFLAPALSTLSNEQLKKVARLWFGIGVASAILGIVQHYVPLYHPLELPDPGLRGYYHSTGMTGWHLSYAPILAFPAMVGLALVAILYRREGLSKRTLRALGIAALFFTANIFTYSKIAWLALPLAIVLIAIIGFKGVPRYALVATVVIFGLAWGFSPQTRLRFQGTNTIKDRLEVWSANIEMIKAHPIFGVGWHHNSDLSRAYYGSKGVVGFESHAHNNLIDQWSTTGLFGLGSYVWWSLLVVIMAYRLYRTNNDLLWRAVGLGFVGGWFALHLHGLTQANWWDAKVLHQIGWVTALTMEAYRRHYKS